MQRVGQELIIEQLAAQGGGKHIAAAVQFQREPGLVHAEHAAVQTRQIADFVFPAGHAGNDGVGRFKPAQDRLGRVVRAAARQQGGLGQVGGNDVRQLAQRAHFLHIIGRKAAVQAAVIAQHGIHQHQGILLREILDDLPGDFNLPDRAEKAGVDAVKMHADALPMGDEGLHFLRHVAHDIAVKAAGVGGQDGGRQSDGFHARSGQDGQRHAQRALAQAG